MAKHPEVGVIGLDGGTWDILLPLVEAGAMPRLGELLARGAYGVLRSVFPPVTAPAWTSFRTGVNPGKHGVFDFARPSFGRGNHHTVVGKDLILYSARDIRAPRLWQMLEPYGKRVGIFNLPFTYPVEPVNGVMIAASMTGGERLADYPAGLVARIVRETGTSFFHRAIEDGVSPTRTYLRHLIRSVAEQAKVDAWLLHQMAFDLYCTVYTQTDVFQHVFYRWIDPHHPYYDRREAEEVRPLVQAFYQAVDRAIGQLLDLCGESTTFFIVSDHGFQPASVSFNVNTFLEQQGLLVRKGGRRGHSSGLSRQRLLRWLARLDVLELRARIPYDVRRRLAGMVMNAGANGLDYERTLAFLPANSAMGIYLRRDLSPEAYAAVQGQIVEGLQSYRDPQTGRLVFEEVVTRDQVYEGPFAHEGPDILLLPAPPYHLRQWNTGSSSILEPHHRKDRSGSHSIRGIFVAFGPGVKHLGPRVEALITDLAPTILHILNVPVPEYLDGRLRTEWFSKAWVATHPVRMMKGYALGTSAQGEVYTEGEMEAIFKRLSDLGYL